jgi:hypothetical protein
VKITEIGLFLQVDDEARQAAFWKTSPGLDMFILRIYATFVSSQAHRFLTKSPFLTRGNPLKYSLNGFYGWLGLFMASTKERFICKADYTAVG